MPVYEYQGQFYELSETDPVAAKKKIVASIGGPAPEGGFFPALRAGATELGGGISALMGRVGLKDVTQAQQEYEAAKKRAAEIFQPTEEGWTEAPWTKFKETLGGSLPYMAAPLAAGAAAATLPVTGPAAAVASLGAAGLASAGQFTATNIARQLEEEKKRTGAYDLAGTDIQSAALAAIPQAALDTIALRFMPGVGKLLGDAGIQVTKESAKQVSEQILKKALTDYAVTTGKAVGREGLTEAAQQVFERLQAGLNITDPDARREYVESFIGGAVLGGALAPAGRYVERGTAAREVAGIEQEEAAQQRQAARAAQEAQKKSPEYALQLDADYQAAVEKMKELQAAVPKRPGKDSLPEEQMAFEQAKAARDAHLRDVLRPLTAEYSPRKAEIAQLKERQRIEGMSPEEYMLEGLGVKPTAAVTPAAEPASMEEAALQAQMQTAEPLLAEPQLSPVEQYAKDRINLANEQQYGTANVADYTDYLLTDPQMAAQLVATNAKLPGLSRKENAAVLGGLKLQLAKQSEEQATALAESRPDLAPPAAETPDPLALWKASLEQSDEQTKEELLGLDFERALSEGAAPVVATPEQIKPIQNPKVLLRQIDDLTAARDTADRDTHNAFGAGNKELGAKKAQEREAAQTALNSVEQGEGPGRAIVALRKAQDTALMNVAQLTDDLRAGRTLGGRSMPSREAFATDEEYAAAVQEERDRRGTASSTPQTLINQINAQRAEFIKAAIQEAAITRRLFGRSLTQDEAIKAGLDMKGVFDEWVTRSMAQPLKAVNWIDSLLAQANAREALMQAPDPRNLPFVAEARDAYVKAQLQQALVKRLGRQRMAEIAKGTAKLKGAETALSADEQRSISAQATKEFNSALVETQKAAIARSTDPRPLEERRFGAYRVATEVLQDQLRKLSSQLVSIPKGPVTREEAVIRRQVAGAEAAKVAEASGETAQTLEGQLRRRRDYVSGLIDQAFQTRRVPGIAETLLTRAQDFITTAPNTFLDAAENIASRILRGQNIERSDLVELRNELRAASARPGEAEVAGERVGQRELFPAEERRALAPKTVGTDLFGTPTQTGALGLIREKPEAFEAVRAKEATKAKRANEAIQKSKKLTQDIKTALAQLDKDRQAELSKQVEESEASLQSAWQSAVKKAKAMVVAARRAAQKPKIASLKAEIDAIRKGGVTGLNKETLDRLFAARKALEDIDAEINEAVDAAEFLPHTAANKWVAFAKGRVEQAKTALAAANTPQNVQALNQQEQALRQAEQARLQSLKGEEKAAEAARMRAAQGQVRDVAGQELPGRRRVAGKVEEIKPEATAQERAEAETARREQVAEESAARAQEREAKQTELEQRVLDLGTQVAELEAAQKRARTPESKAKLQTQIDALTKEARIAQGKLDAFGEAKPRKKGPATVVSGAGLAKQRPLRTGTGEAKEVAERFYTKKAATKVSVEEEARQATQESARAAAKAAAQIAEKFRAQTPAQKARAEKQEAAVAKIQQKEEIKALRKASRLQQLFKDTDDEVLFSRGTTENPSTIDSVRTELKKTFPDLGRAQIYDSVDALIKANPQYEGKIPSDARGFVDTAGNKAFLIAENIEQGQALSVLLHEVGTHIGLKNMLGDAQYNSLVNAVKSWEKKADGSIEARVAKAARARVEAAETKPGQVNDELLAYAVEEAVNAGVKPTETKGVLGRWLSQIAALFRKGLEKFGLPPKELDAQRLVDMAFGAAQMEMRGQVKAVEKTPEETAPAAKEILFSRNLPTAARVADQIIGKQPTMLDSVKKNMGLAFRTQVIDALAPLEKIANTAMDALKGTQMMYYLRMYGMRNNMVAEAISNGVVQLKQIERADGEKEWVLESEKGVNIKDMVKRLAQKDVVKEAGSPDAANRLFTLYMAALRGERVGYNKLSFGRAAAEAELRTVERELASPSLTPEDKPRLVQRKAYLEKNIDSLPTEADFKAAKAEIESNATLKNAFDEVRGMYNEYNTNLLKLLVDTGAMSKELADRLLKEKDYIPYYRMRGGNAELVIGGETPIRVGNIKDSPHLQELVGGEEPIFNFLDSSVQNTSMLLDMALRNVAAKNVAYELADVGLASKPVKAGKSGAPKGSLEFKKDGVDHYVIVNTDHVGVPSDLLVKGMAGIPTMLPVGIRLLGIPARILRRAVTSTPIFAAKQLFRDSTAAFIISGTNSTPLLGALRQLGKTSPLEARGITGGQTFTGMPEDVSRLLREMQEGRPGWSKAFAKMEALSIEADAATRRAQYDSYRAQGLSEMEATLMALESMNFSKRGLSPTMHMASTLVPFLNSQIQGLDVLYKAFTGKLPFNEKLDIQRKLFTRGALMFMGTMAYAAAMQDDEEYKNAPPDVKYGNWFVRVPFLDQYAGEPVTVRVPVPFEIGYIFKALPEMLYNSMQSQAGAKDALKALNQILIQMVPGGSSMVPIQIGDAKIPAPVIIPAAMKPIIEVGLGKSFFTGRDIESAREQQEVPGMRYRPGTSEIAKYIGEATNFSPIKIEALVSGYTGGLGLALLNALSLPLPKAATEVPEKRWSELPLVGSIFQPSDAQGIVNDVYERLQKVTQAAGTYKSLVERGELGKAQAFLQKNLPLIALESIAGSYRKDMGDLAKDERLIRGAPTLTAEEKTKLLAQIRQTKIQIASQVRNLLAQTTEASERKTLQASLP